MAKQDADLRKRLTDLADMVEALVQSLADADIVTRADLYAKIKAIAGKRTSG